MSFDLESCERSSSSCSIDDKLPSTNNLIRGKEGQYAVGRKLAQGRYGAVFELSLRHSSPGQRQTLAKVLRKSDGKAFACKLEICGPNSHGLDMDYVVMSQVAKKGCNHLVRMIDRGKIEDHFKFLIMPLLGDNLTKIRHQFVDGRLSLSSGLRLAFLALSPIKELHNIGFVHRDIKCSNFCLTPHSSRGNTQLVLIDYGVCRAYKDKTGSLKAPREQVRFR
ncbi:hypothetical protein ANCCEY_12656 [Ancylostoma ceylanicum]|uniref:non-specific serine/threonine protein kinase n=1 Tax=Ancylostoma ceylanicum TaxID=53326 RepID=A0A0D6L8R5_9BILA|nr:hypothetical protein ANCCEY_12656 [Ancylostoma ceylanicum]